MAEAAAATAHLRACVRTGGELLPFLALASFCLPLWTPRLSARNCKRLCLDLTCVLVRARDAKPVVSRAGRSCGGEAQANPLRSTAVTDMWAQQASRASGPACSDGVTLQPAAELITKPKPKPKPLDVPGVQPAMGYNQHTHAAAVGGGPARRDTRTHASSSASPLETPRARRRHSLLVLVAGAAGNLTWAWVPSLLWDSNLPPPGSTICYSRAVVYPVKMHHRLFPLVFHCHCARL